MPPAAPAVATALIVMCKAPAPGYTKSRLCPPLTNVQASDLYAALVTDTLEQVVRRADVTPVAAVSPPSGADYFRELKFERLQVWEVDGADIGVCLHRVLSAALQRGHRHAIAINSDGPTMPAERINQARAALDAGHDLVFGPNEDGGYYLIGLTAANSRLLCNGDLELRDIEWSSGKELEQTLARAETLGLTSETLASHYDVDRIDDLQRLRCEIEQHDEWRVRRTRRWLDEHPPTALVAEHRATAT